MIYLEYVRKCAFSTRVVLVLGFGIRCTSAAPGRKRERGAVVEYRGWQYVLCASSLPLMNICI